MKFLKNNFKIKILSLFLAFISWMVVMETVNPDEIKEFRNIPIIIINENKLKENDMEIIESNEFTINVSLEGKRKDLNRINSKSVQASIDISNYAVEGTHKIPIKIEKPSQFNIEDQSKKEVVLSIDKIIERKFDIVVEIKEGTKDNFVLGKKTVNPSSINIRGTSSMINQIQKVVAEVNVHNLTESISQNVELKVFGKNNSIINDIELDPKDANINVEINQVKEVPIKIKTIGKLEEGITVININTVPNKITILGKKEFLEKVDEIETTPIDLANIIDDSKIKLSFNIPDGVEILNKKTNYYYDITVDKMIEKVIYVSPSRVKMKNISDNFNLTFMENNFIQVKINGKKSHIEEWSSKDIKLKVKDKSLMPGENEFTLELEAMKGVDLISIEPQTIKVKLTEK